VRLPWPGPVYSAWVPGDGVWPRGTPGLEQRGPERKGAEALHWNTETLSTETERP
jgi:hypothetical protein